MRKGFGIPGEENNPPKGRIQKRRGCKKKGGSQKKTGPFSVTSQKIEGGKAAKKKSAGGSCGKMDERGDP